MLFKILALTKIKIHSHVVCFHWNKNCFFFLCESPYELTLRNIKNNWNLQINSNQRLLHINEITIQLNRVCVCVYDVVCCFALARLPIFMYALALALMLVWFPFDLFVVTFYGVHVCVLFLFYFSFDFNQNSLLVFTLLCQLLDSLRNFMNDCVRPLRSIFFSWESLS